LCSWIFYFNYFTVAHIAVNFLMVSVCLWVIANPGVNGFITIAFALLICGLWNLFVTFYIGVALFNVILIGIGVLQLAYAIQSYRLYQSFVLLPAPKPAPELKQRYDTIWKSIVGANSNDSADFVKLGMNTNQYWWQGLYTQNQVKQRYMLLLPKQAVLAYKDRKWLDFVPKTEVIIEIGEGYSVSFPEPKPAVENTKAKSLKRLSKIQMFARLNDEVWSGYLDPVGFENYMGWKKFSDSEAVKQAINTETFANERQIHNKIKKGKSTAVLVYIFIAVILIIYVMQHLPNL